MPYGLLHMCALVCLLLLLKLVPILTQEKGPKMITVAEGIVSISSSYCFMLSPRPKSK